jgi:hypothetical protein
LPISQEQGREAKEHLSLGQIRGAINKLLLDEYCKTGNFFNVGKQIEDEENYQTAKMPLKWLLDC